jgi:hypothetical protein
MLDLTPLPSVGWIVRNARSNDKGKLMCYFAQPDPILSRSSVNRPIDSDQREQSTALQVKALVMVDYQIGQIIEINQGEWKGGALCFVACFTGEAARVEESGVHVRPESVFIFAGICN